MVQRTFPCSVTQRVAHTYQTSPGKNVIFPSIYLLHLLCATFGRKDFVLFSKLIQLHLAFYEVRVPQTGGLPLASFRFHVTMDTLALS
ncbi:hypothetical protein CFK40_16790 [Virgibacillus necropolis]|uniref:Uncharacterized protein n=1 Tax=Virgibacillus necropolis TaxID=163877 RepID=A0A221MG30_9BACI|nr:hypothetical protein CFK40_16765 [Virgibacillus necropolis]ASN06553.1 hypothetical protein CFK40_16790 [Virgibacillus necropolis]